MEFDLDDLKLNLENVLKSLGADLTSPEYEERIAAITNDYAALATMKIQGASEDMIQDASDTLNARARALAEAPGLMTANRQNEFLTALNSALSFGIHMAFQTARIVAG